MHRLRLSYTTVLWTYLILIMINGVVCWLCEGGGCSEMVMSNAVTTLAGTTAGKEAVAMEAFARALRQVRFYSIFRSVINCTIGNCSDVIC